MKIDVLRCLLVCLLMSIVTTVYAQNNIFLASRDNELPVLRRLLKAHPALVNSKDENYKTPLHYAVETNAYEAAEFLLTHKANVNAPARYSISADIDKYVSNRTPLHEALLNPAHERMVPLLMQYNVNVNAPRFGWSNPFSIGS